MKIWVGNRFHPRDLLGGAELQSLQLAKGLRDRGHEVCFFALEGKGEDWDDQGLPVSVLDPNSRPEPSLALPPRFNEPNPI